MNRRMGFIVLTTAVAVTLTGCETGGGVTYYRNGPAGQVVEREIEDGHYEIDTKDAKGKKHEFNVAFSVYNDCQLHSYYPACVKSPKVVKPKVKKSDKVNKLPKQKAPKKDKNSGGFSFGGSKKSGKK